MKRVLAVAALSLCVVGCGSDSDDNSGGGGSSAAGGAAGNAGSGGSAGGSGGSGGTFDCGTAPGLIPNGSFEEWSGGAPVGWTVVDGTLAESAALGTAPAGCKSVRLVPNQPAAGLQQTFPITEVTATTTVDFGGLAKVAQDNGTSARATIRLLDSASTERYSQELFLNCGTDLCERSISLELMPGDAQIQLDLRVDGSDSPVEFDSFYVTPQ
jgi:hypothetical protein